MLQKIWSLYRITNKINGKIYIGQATNISKRWSDHRAAVQKLKPTQIIHHAMIKYGLDNFEFEVIASCKTQEDANETETELVKQYDSFISNGKGYNATLGGMNAPKTEAWRNHMSKVMTPKLQEYFQLETPEQKEERYTKVSASLKGMQKVPGSGTKKGFKHSEESKRTFSQSHIGQVAYNRKFTKEEIILIREQYSQGISCPTLAKMHSADRTTIWEIVTKRTYKDC